MVGASRMVVGHSPQLDGITGTCEGRLWNTDVGTSIGVFGNSPAVLELTILQQQRDEDRSIAVAFEAKGEMRLREQKKAQDCDDKGFSH
eukprot:SAG31_NODE_41224_length_277_cov_0.584270_1_plen_88_part_10